MITGRSALISLAIIAGASIVAGASILLFSPSTQYRDCVALMWDRKHPAEVKRRQEEAWLRECEADQLRYGPAKGQCNPLPFPDVMPGSPGPNAFVPNPCEHLSLEELRRADAEANRDKP